MITKLADVFGEDVDMANHDSYRRFMHSKEERFEICVNFCVGCDGH
jgi:hypothetical protein